MFIRELVFGLVLHGSDTSQFSMRSHRQFFFSIYLITLCISFGSCKAAGTENTPAVSVLKKSVPRQTAQLCCLLRFALREALQAVAETAENTYPPRTVRI